MTEARHDRKSVSSDVSGTQRHVEIAVRAAIAEGQVLHTPTRQAPFVVGRIDSDGVVLLLGAGRWRTRITWACLEGVVPYIRQHGGIVDIGGRHEVQGKPGTLDGYLKGCINRTTAGWVAVLLATAGVIEIVHTRPARVRIP